ncbi:MAG: hypothetical protein ACRD8Z_16465 [Nitrososphaeraceae archaeon]
MVTSQVKQLSSPETASAATQIQAPDQLEKYSHLFQSIFPRPETKSSRKWRTVKFSILTVVSALFATAIFRGIFVIDP